MKTFADFDICRCGHSRAVHLGIAGRGPLAPARERFAREAPEKHCHQFTWSHHAVEALGDYLERTTGDLDSPETAQLRETYQRLTS